MEVLRVLNVAPTQLHPNSWAAIQAFRLLCDVLSLRPIARSFLHFFGTRPGDRICWLSLVGQTKNSLFAPYTTSYKNFKTGFFKVVIEEGGRQFFFDGETPKFPFYWTKDPTRFNLLPRSLMTDDDWKCYRCWTNFLARFQPGPSSVPTCPPIDVLMLMVCVFTRLCVRFTMTNFAFVLQV